jgi:rhodanese-related sulfurtransferase
MKQLTPEELKAWLDSNRNICLIDVREKWEYDLCKIPNAVLAPLGGLQGSPPQVDKQQTVVVYCHHGRRSMIGCTLLEALGYTDVYNLTGGIDLYSERVDPKIERY